MKTIENVSYIRDPEVPGIEISRVVESSLPFSPAIFHNTQPLLFNPWSLTAMQVLAGSIFFLPGGVLLFRVPGVVWTRGLVASLIFLGVGVTLGAFGLYNFGISRISASRASAFINGVPVVAVVLGWALLGEALNAWQFVA